MATGNDLVVGSVSTPSTCGGVLHADHGADYISGSNGDDTLIGGAADNTMTGGDGDATMTVATATT